MGSSTLSSLRMWSLYVVDALHLCVPMGSDQIADLIGSPERGLLNLWTNLLLNMMLLLNLLVLFNLLF
jgi:hypothetical protein